MSLYGKNSCTQQAATHNDFVCHKSHATSSGKKPRPKSNGHSKPIYKTYIILFNLPCPKCHMDIIISNRLQTHVKLKILDDWASAPSPQSVNNRDSMLSNKS